MIKLFFAKPTPFASRMVQRFLWFPGFGGGVLLKVFPFSVAECMG
jgi:hypothetical protein